MRIILLNGPPSSGKDTVARMLIEYLTTVSMSSNRLLRMSHPIKRAFAGTFGYEIDEMGNVDYWEQRKDEPSILLGGKSYRQWQIDFSEKFMKPLYGEDIFAKIFVSDVAVRPAKYIIVPDCGFEIEADTVGRLMPEDLIMLVQIRRPGCDFSKDSRNYVYAKHVPLTIQLDNDAGLDVLSSKAMELLSRRTWDGFAG